jgi:AcrR family transcriptional regulator
MATQVKVNPNDPRVKRTRQLLIQALADVLGEKSFHDITIQDITDRATVNRVTFYAHFEDKYDLVGTLIRDGFVERLEAELPATSPLTPANLRLLCRVVIQSLGDSHTQCRTFHDRYGPLFESAVQEALYAFILDWLRHWAPDEPLPGVHTEALAVVMSWTLFGAGIDYTRNHRDQPVDRFVDEVAAVSMNGVSDVFRSTRP